MGRKRLPEGEKKYVITIALKEKILNAISKDSKIQRKTIEDIITEKYEEKQN